MIRRIPVIAALVLVAGCGEADTDPGPGGVTVGEARALDQAAEMLDQQRLPDEALADPAADSPADSPADSGASEPVAAATESP